MATIVCVPVTAEADIDHRWGRAARVAVARVDDGRVQSWEESDVHWDREHDEQGEGKHHAKIARFLLDHSVGAVVVDHMGEPMHQMLGRMGVDIYLGASGPAREAVEALLRGGAPEIR